MDGQHYVIRNEEQRGNFARMVSERPLSFQGKLAQPYSPKSGQQIRYAHSMCNCLAAYRQSSPDAAKQDAKREFGVIIVCTSLVTGDRSARLKSFADYSRDEMKAFLLQMEVFLDENQIPYTPCEN